jgi:hypothetical protein
MACSGFTWYSTPFPDLNGFKCYLSQTGWDAMYQDKAAVSGSSEDTGIDHNCFVKKPLGFVDISTQNREEV